MTDGGDDLDRRLRDHFAAIAEPLPGAVVAAARARLEPRRGPRVGGLLAAASLAAVALMVVVVAVGTPSPDPDAPSTPVTASPTAEATAPPSASGSAPAYGPGQTLRATRSIPLTTDWTIRVGQVLYVNAVDGDRYEIQHWGDLDTGMRPDTVIGTVDIPTVDSRTEPYVPACPSGFEGIEPVAALQPFERLACFGSRSITVAPVRREAYEVMSGNPPWLAGPAGVDFFLGLPFAVADLVDVPSGTWLRVTGHFDDAGCDGDLLCRERLVVTSFEPARPPPSELPGEWRVMAPAPIAGRTSPASVWTGREFIIWAGQIAPDPASEAVAPTKPDGAAYDLATDTWRQIADSPLGHRGGPQAVWSGTEMLVWGGWAGSTPQRDGAAYDPSTDTWRRLPDAPFAATQLVWAVDRVIAIGDSGEAASFDPVTDDWTDMPRYPVRDGWMRSLVWTGSDVLVFIATNGVDTPTEGFRLRLGDAGWRPIAASPQWALYAGRMVWTDTEAVGVAGPNRSESGQSGAAAFDPATDRWREIPPCNLDALNAVWTGELILSHSGAFDPATGGCSTLPVAPQRGTLGTNSREFFAFAWTGDAYLAWSGGTGSDLVYNENDGVIFRPERP